MNTFELDLIGGDEAELTALVSAFVQRKRRLPRYEELVAMRHSRHPRAESRTGGCARPHAENPSQ